jgi:peptide methionine sulfoxide reductase msrA/msrB
MKQFFASCLCLFLVGCMPTGSHEEKSVVQREEIVPSGVDVKTEEIEILEGRAIAGTGSDEGEMIDVMVQKDIEEIVPETIEATVDANVAVATFAGGCFWCMEPAYQELPGVLDAVVGFSGGTKETSDYATVSGGKTAHREVVQVTFDPEILSYEELLDIFWRQIDPTDSTGQFADKGFQYTTAIYAHDETQQLAAEKAIEVLDASEKFKDSVVTVVEPYTNFYLANDYHQDFYIKSAEYYQRYKKGSGRADFIEENWAKNAAIEYQEEQAQKQENIVVEEIEEEEEKYKYTPEEIADLLENLDPLAYHVVAENGTEEPFNNAYWDNKADGIYVDKVTNEPLFSSTHKYDSGTGWPSFWRTIEDDSVTLHADNSLSVERTEIRSQAGHVGHVFEDGPEEEGGRRFCTNSSSLLFVVKTDMTQEGYEDYLYLFDQ